MLYHQRSNLLHVSSSEAKIKEEFNDITKPVKFSTGFSESESSSKDYQTKHLKHFTAELTDDDTNIVHKDPAIQK